MNRLIPLTAFAAGFALLTGLVAVRFKRDRDRFQTQLEHQQQATISGWEGQWRTFLLTKARAGSLPATYALEFSRSGQDLKSDFFPTRAVQMRWEEYRLSDDPAKSRTFLEKAFATSGSWDRVLAIKAWRERFGGWPDLKFSAYEQTLANEEAYHAYRLIFAQFSKNRDFTLAETQYQYDEVFFRVTATGNIHAFVPSARAVRRDILPEFLKQQMIPRATLGRSPWEITFSPTVAGQDFPYARDEWLLAAGSIVFLGAGAILLGLHTRAERKRLSRKVSFLNQVVHEIKTPLTGMKLHVDLLARHGWRRESLEAVEKSVRRMDKLFSEITLLNRISSRQDNSQTTAAELIEVMRTLAAEHPGCQIPATDLREPVRGNRTAIEIILRNLVSNGISYGETVTVSWSEGDRTRIDVTDQGPGVTAADSRMIFSEFYRAECARLRRPGGLGLGLAVAQRLAREINADLWLDNPGTPAARFSLSLERSNT